MKLLKGMNKVDKVTNRVFAWFLTDNNYLFYIFNKHDNETSITIGTGNYTTEYLKKWGYAEIKIV